ncbi:hypothetical protein CDL12_24770 [Handroanthus impetiginosus]|uniref:BRX domain-containing protein n=1 Tax=Handroanthus impetiginosus TaxID=429701 RepID=A0A2G9GBX7_9LAMI|nr:hypothetical protein CDL12_24770 [Handroanthus impetiginosus]
MSAQPKVQEGIDKYEPGMAHGDGSKGVKRTRSSCSWTKIETWLYNIKEKVETWLYNIKEKVGKKYKDPNELASFGRNELLPLSEATFDRSTRSRNSDVPGNDSAEIVSERVENYEPGVFVVLGDLRDGTRDVLLVGFSGRRFKVLQAKAWWHSNKENVYQKYSAGSERARLRQSSRLKKTDNFIVVEWIEEYKTAEATWVHLRQEAKRSFIKYNGIPLLAHVNDTILEINFDEILISANRDGRIRSSDQPVRAELIERCETGVYLSLESSDRIRDVYSSLEDSDRIRDVKRVRFSRNIFTPDEAVEWWIKNRENVRHKYMGCHN